MDDKHGMYEQQRALALACASMGGPEPGSCLLLSIHHPPSGPPSGLAVWLTDGSGCHPLVGAFLFWFPSQVCIQVCSQAMCSVPSFFQPLGFILRMHARLSLFGMHTVLAGRPAREKPRVKHA